MKHIIIGTAGHVDHGKTVLVKKLTGVDTDRLKEEKERGISIELGFAYMKLPGGQTAGIVDVPGHERFIKNMLAGVGGIDLVLLVIAADEGVMPQTREHLEIIQLLQIDKGVVVITKKDLVDDEWLKMVYDDTKEFLSNTVLEKADIIAVSAVTGEGLPELINAVNQIAAGIEERKTTGPARLPVDRVFSVTGFGTVATGTLISGQIQTGESLQIYPGETVSRVRNMHVHGKKVELAESGQRVAVNLSGIETDDIKRGNVLALPASLKPSHRLDVSFKYLSSAPKALRHRARVRVYLGTAEILGRVILFDREELQQGEHAYVQLQLESPIAAARKDHFVVRSYSPMRTVGGGTIIDPFPNKHKRYRKEIIEALATAEKGSAVDWVEQYLNANAKLHTVTGLTSTLGMSKNDMAMALTKLTEERQAAKFATEGEDYFVSAMVLQQWENRIISALQDYHRKFPLREGYPKEELRSRFFSALTAKQFQILLNHFEKNQKISGMGHSVAIFEYKPLLSKEMGQVLHKFENIFLTSKFQPPSWSEATAQTGIKRPAESQEFLNYLLGQGKLVKITEGIFFHRQVLDKAISMIKEHFKQKSELSLGELRDLLQTSRKYALPLLEYTDREKITRRVGDLRVAGKLLI
ncbi:selenocysteine-specific elongation factor [Desulfotomaculum arcticum]|uniref:Selenocysteine-specific elongation factor n=1 Tax=Desulfotruncus arcticus DSM 17038 TaxID=1121424 RepID=A0A1I2ND15_9FIRM|nr:selenocysteine-specific translation elongation factor [Desulfotruncus arcticus]SFG00759.1 selenocysteine-specific elongation factor [Desulfotomaculum arcticum] [Desulfotruncus arcticus DSM 17038]